MGWLVALRCELWLVRPFVCVSIVLNGYHIEADSGGCFMLPTKKQTSSKKNFTKQLQLTRTVIT